MPGLMNDDSFEQWEAARTPTGARQVLETCMPPADEAVDKDLRDVVACRVRSGKHVPPEVPVMYGSRPISALGGQRERVRES